MNNNLKTATEKLGTIMVKEFMESKSYKDDDTFDAFKTMCIVMDGIVTLFEDVEQLKKENELLKQKIEGKS